MVSQLTTSVLKGFGFTLIYVYNRVMGEGQEGERKDGGMFLRNHFSDHMSTKSFLFLPKSTTVISAASLCEVLFHSYGLLEK